MSLRQIDYVCVCRCAPHARFPHAVVPLEPAVRTLRSWTSLTLTHAVATSWSANPMSVALLLTRTLPRSHACSAAVTAAGEAAIKAAEKAAIAKEKAAKVTREAGPETAGATASGSRAGSVRSVSKMSSPPAPSSPSSSTPRASWLLAPTAGAWPRAFSTARCRRQRRTWWSLGSLTGGLSRLPPASHVSVGPAPSLGPLLFRGGTLTLSRCAAPMVSSASAAPSRERAWWKAVSPQRRRLNALRRRRTPASP